MRTVIAGGHGKIALRLEKLLADRGDQAVGLIRAAAQADDLRAAGAEPAVCDLEQVTVDDLARVLAGADAVVFAAGAGGGSQSGRTQAVDHDGAVKLADAAQRAGVKRYLMVSSMGAGTAPADADPTFAAYLKAKGDADADIMARPGLEWTVLRPGWLTDDAGTGRVLLAEHTGRGGVPRDDVAAVLATLLATPSTAAKVLELISGEELIRNAVHAQS